MSSPSQQQTAPLSADITTPSQFPPGQKIRTAVVGTGWVATHRHIPVMQASGTFEVVGVIDRSPGRAGRTAQEKRLRYFAESGELSKVEWLKEVDAITIATAPMSHYQLIRDALKLGKHVLTEKPFAMSVAEGEELVATAATKNLRLAVMHNFQFARSTRKLLDEIATGELGTLRAISAVQLGNPGRRLPEWYEQLPLGLFYDESPHLLYLLRRVAGELDLRRCLVHPSSAGLKTPARLDAHFSSHSFAGPITLSCSFESPVSEWYLMVFGEKRLGIVDVFRDIYLSLPNDGEHKTASVVRTSATAIRQHVWQHIISGIPHLRGKLYYGNDEVYRRFASAVHGQLADFEPVNAESALAVLRMQHALIERAETISAVPVELVSG